MVLSMFGVTKVRNFSLKVVNVRSSMRLMCGVWGSMWGSMCGVPGETGKSFGQHDVPIGSGGAHAYRCSWH